MLIVLLLNMTILFFSLQLVHEKNGMFVSCSGFNFFFLGAALNLIWVHIGPLKC